MSPARISLLVETNSLLLITVNRSLRLWKGLGISALVPAGESDIGEFPCIFPVDQGFGLQRRVRSRLPAPPFSLRVAETSRAHPGSPRNSRDSAGFWPLNSGASEPETAGSGPKISCSPRFSLLPSWAVRIRSRFACPSRELVLVKLGSRCRGGQAIKR